MIYIARVQALTCVLAYSRDLCFKGGDDLVRYDWTRSKLFADGPIGRAGSP